MLIGGIDIGTLTCRLLVAEVTLPHLFHELDSDRQILRLGEGVDSHKKLSPQAMDRVVKVLKEWKTRLAAYSLDAMVVVATSAVRDAHNQKEFLDRIMDEIGWRVEVLTGTEEARRTLLGVRFGLPENIQKFLVVDIGGGSTEYIFSSPVGLPHAVSLDLGVVRLTERILVHDPPTQAEMRAAETEIVNHLEIAKKKFGPHLPASLVGTAGTITTLAAMDQGLARYDRTKVHHYVLSLDTIRRWEHEISQKTSLQRLAIPGLERGREQVIAAGTVIIRKTMEYFGYDRCLVSDFGLREGVLVDCATRGKSNPDCTQAGIKRNTS